MNLLHVVYVEDMELVVRPVKVRVDFELLVGIVEVQAGINSKRRNL